ncbi:MAG TPA: GNAT family N-acetyltransferase [Ideonella sp.]|uniref:GNAT family N-acetyltransferase n=1 Tax=Ideonella sp. TaxID=1929293 RepID=UPI002BC44F1A|nr:GNAT family N-acetyltransferase [Ideonella sp.]HSI47606.1 GNAT family N-acetyltransferase [Ideonella sp.]
MEALHDKPRLEGITLRQASLADLDLVCDLAQELNVIHHQAWPDVFAPPASPSRDRLHWQDSMLGADRAIFVVEDAFGQSLGFIALSLIEERHSLLQPMRYGRVNSVCVCPEARGMGLGRAMMAQADDWAREHRATDMRLVVWAFNEQARKLYEELGYEVLSHTMGKRLS